MGREQKDFISKLIPPRMEEDSPLTRAMVDIYEVLNKLVDHVNETKGGSAIKSMDESALPGTVRVRRKGPDKYNIYIKGPDGWLEGQNDVPEGKHYLWKNTSQVIVNHANTATSGPGSNGLVTYTVTTTGTRVPSNDYVWILREGHPQLSTHPKSVAFNEWKLIKKKDK
jgi:hypothetical protein